METAAILTSTELGKKKSFEYFIQYLITRRGRSYSITHGLLPMRNLNENLMKNFKILLDVNIHIDCAVALALVDVQSVRNANISFAIQNGRELN